MQHRFTFICSYLSSLIFICRSPGHIGQTQLPFSIFEEGADIVNGGTSTATESVLDTTGVGSISVSASELSSSQAWKIVWIYSGISSNDVKEHVFVSPACGCPVDFSVRWVIWKAIFRMNSCEMIRKEVQIHSDLPTCHLHLWDGRRNTSSTHRNNEMHRFYLKVKVPNYSQPLYIHYANASFGLLSLNVPLDFNKATEYSVVNVNRHCHKADTGHHSNVIRTMGCLG